MHKKIKELIFLWCWLILIWDATFPMSLYYLGKFFFFIMSHTYFHHFHTHVSILSQSAQPTVRVVWSQQEGMFGLYLYRDLCLDLYSFFCLYLFHYLLQNLLRLHSGHSEPFDLSAKECICRRLQKFTYCTVHCTM